MLGLWPETFWREGGNCKYKRDVGRLANWLLSLVFGIMNSSPNFSPTELSDSLFFKVLVLLIVENSGEGRSYFQSLSSRRTLEDSHKTAGGELKIY